MNQALYKKIAVLLFTVLFHSATETNAETITTTAQGGLWIEKSTWVGEKIPTKDDNVIITSVVTTGDLYYNLEMTNLTINEGGKIIRDAKHGWYTMNIFGNLINNGEIIDDLGHFNIKLYGNLENKGVLKPKYIYLVGEKQHISGTHPIGPNRLYLQMSDDSVVAASDLHFHNCFVQGNTDKTLDMRTYNLKLSADSIVYTTHWGGGLYSECQLRVPVNFEDTGIIELDNSVLQGAIQGDFLLKSPSYAFLSDLSVNGNMTIEKGIKVSSYANLTKLKVSESFYNYGQMNNDTIRVGSVEAPVQSMYLTVYGDAVNFGTTGITKVFMTTNGDTLTMRGDYAGDVKFQQSEGNETPGGKVVINEEVNISGKVEVFTTLEVAADGTLNLLSRNVSPIYVKGGLGEVFNKGNIFRYHLVNNSWGYRKYENQPGTFVDFELRNWEDRIEGVEVSVFNNQTYPGLPGSTNRWWRIKPLGDGDLTAYTIKFYYDEALLNGQKEENLKVYRSVDEGETWEVVSVIEHAVLDTVENYISIGVWNKTESMLSEFGDFVISAGEGSVPIANNFKIDMVGRPDVRIGAPNPYTIHVYNVTDFFTGPIMLAMDVSEDIRFKEIHLPYNDGVEIIPIDSISDPNDLTQVFFIPYLEPNEHYSFDVIVYGIPESMKSATEDMVTLTVGGFFGDQVQGGAVDYIVDEVGKAAELNDAEKEEYARGLGLTVNDLKSNKQQYGRTVTAIRSVSKYTIGKIAETNPVTNVLFKIGDGIESVSKIKDSLRRRLFHWFYKEVGLYGVEEKVASGQQIKGKLVSSWDPNEIVGPAGFGEQNHMAEIPRMNYTIYFENLKEATAPAYRVQIVDTLSALFNPETVTFAETSHSGTGYKWKIERDGNILKWDIEGIELPPNVTPPEGEGFVRFSVELNQGLPSGTVIENRATIIFDMNPPITTNTWVNVLDFEAPSSVMNEIHYSAGDTLITVSCNASDNENGSGIGMYEFFASVDYGPFKSVGQSAINSIRYQISDSTNTNYRFYALVTDNVGNAEQTIPEVAGLNSLLVSSEMNDHPGTTISFYPNPAETNVNIGFFAKNQSQLLFKIYSVNGNLLHTLNKGWFNPGQHRVTIDISFLDPGIYLIEAIPDNKPEFFKLIKR